MIRTTSRNLCFGTVAGLIFALSMAPAEACSLAPDWKPPTTEEIMQGAERAFIGTVVAVRGDDGVLVGEFPPDNFPISAVIKVEVAIHGVEVGQLIEFNQYNTSCDTPYRPGDRLLVPGGPFGPDILRKMPSAEQIDAWRKLPYNPDASAQPRDCNSNTPTDEVVLDRLAFSQLSFVGRVAGLRRDDAVLLTEAMDCPAAGRRLASPECKQFWSHIVAVQFVVDTELQGLAAGSTYEIPTGRCEAYAPGDHWVVIGYPSLNLHDTPSEELLETYRKAAQQAN